MVMKKPSIYFKLWPVTFSYMGQIEKTVNIFQPLARTISYLGQIEKDTLFIGEMRIEKARMVLFSAT
jgi:hypothetical protein